MVFGLVRLTAAAVAIAVATAAGAGVDEPKFLGDCTQKQVRFYLERGLSEGDVVDLCETHGALSCQREKCVSRKVDDLLRVGFSDRQIEVMCGRALCPQQAGY